MSRQEYKLALDISESQIADGNYISADDFEQEEN